MLFQYLSLSDGTFFLAMMFYSGIVCGISLFLALSGILHEEDNPLAFLCIVVFFVSGFGLLATGNQ